MVGPRSQAEIGRVVAGRYRLVAPIGVGASAQVFLADDVRLDRRVALKILHDALVDEADFTRRFRAEARAAAALSHPNVVAIFDWGEDDVTFISTEYLAGGSLRSVLDHEELLSPSQALAVAIDTARALDYAHRRGFVHRDIKPANLLFGEEGRLRVADFGLARALAEAAWTEPQGAMVGTARYASPEQAQGEPLTGAADVYSLALVVIEAVTGEVPFQLDTTLGTLMARVDRIVPLAPELGPLRPVLARAADPNPAYRLDARGFAAGLLEVASQLPRPEPLRLPGALAAGVTAGDAHPTVHLGADATILDGDGDVAGDHAAGAVALLPGSADADADEGGLDPEPDEERIALLDPPDTADADEYADDGDGAGYYDDAYDGDAYGDDEYDDYEADGDYDDRDTAEVPIVEVDDDEPAERRRRRWPAVLLVLALIAAAIGVGAFLRSRGSDPAPKVAAGPPIVLPVPSIEGLDREQISKFLGAAGWKVDVKMVRRNLTVPGSILEMNPAAGTRLAAGSTVELVISEGQEIIGVPQGLEGKTTEDVTAALNAVGLNSKVAGEDYDEDIPKGDFLRYAEGTPPQIEWGSEIGLIQSQGPRPRPVPTGLANKTVLDATNLIQAVQLTVAVTEEYSETVEKGLVIRQSPNGGSIDRGATVTIVVSKGPELVAVPNVASAKDTAEANAMIRAAGLTPGSVSGPAEGTPKSTDPAAGSQVRKNTTINIVLG